VDRAIRDPPLRQVLFFSGGTFVWRVGGNYPKLLPPSLGRPGVSAALSTATAGRVPSKKGRATRYVLGLLPKQSLIKTPCWLEGEGRVRRGKKRKGGISTLAMISGASES